MLETLKIARHVAIEEGDPHTRVDRKPAVLPGEHVGGGMGIEKPLPLEERDHAAADPFGEPGQVCGGERPGGQEHRRPVGAVRTRQEDAVGDGCVEMGVAVEPGAEAVEEGDGAEPRAGGWRCGMLRAAEALETEQRLDLIQQNPRHRRDGLGPVTEHSPQPLRQRHHPLPHGHRGDDVIDEVRCRLRHVPAVTGRAHAPALARKCDDEPLRAPRAESAGESEAEKPEAEALEKPGRPTFFETPAWSFSMG